MSTEITVPRLGWSMEEAVFSSWLKGDGDMVHAGDMLFAIESDKATQEIESFDSGLLHIPPSTPKSGDTVVVGQVIGHLLAKGEVPPVAGPASTATALPLPAKQAASPTASPLNGPAPVGAKSDALISTPRARRVAGELGVDWTGLHGSGRGGRIREADIRSAAAKRPSGAAPLRRQGGVPQPAMNRHRLTPSTLHAAADVTALLGLLRELKTAETITRIPSPTFIDLLLKFTAIALQSHRALNAWCDDDTMELAPDIHIGLAVDVGECFRHPVIRDVGTLPLRALTKHRQLLVDQVTSGQHSAEVFEGGTFTVIDLGALGIDAFTPQIPQGQCAALGIGRVVRRLVVLGESEVRRDIISLSLAVDAAWINPALSAHFLHTLTRLIESPQATLAS